MGLDVATGVLVWERPFVSGNFTNSATPIVAGQTVIVSNGGPVTAVTVTKRDGTWIAEDAWTNADQPYRLSNPVLIGETLFGLSTRNSGQYFAVDVKSGKSLWTSEPRQAGQAAVVKAGPIVFSLEDDGELIVGRLAATAFEPLRSVQGGRQRNVDPADHLGQPAVREGCVDADALDDSLNVLACIRPVHQRCGSGPEGTLRNSPVASARRVKRAEWIAPLK